MVASMDLVLSESFVAVSDTGTISAAAQKLNISQSALSRRLQQLERHLGVQLLVRKRDGVELTAAGRRTIVVSRQILDQYGQLRHDLNQHADLSHGLVRVGGGATAASLLLPPCVARLHDAHPGLRFYVREAGSATVAADVTHGELDLGIITTPIDESAGIDLEPLLDDEIVLVAPTGHRLTGSKVRAHTLNEEPVIAFEPTSAIRRIIDEALLAADIKLQIVAELRSIPTMLQMVRQTGIPAFVSRLSLADNTDLLPVNVSDLEIRRQLAIATRQHVTTTPATDAFRDALRRQAAGRAQ